MTARILVVLTLALAGGCDLHPPSPPCRVADPQPDYHANAGCVILADNHVLVLTHRRHRKGGKLGIPGGAQEGDESAQCTAHRETWEETGLDVRVGEMLGRMRYGFTLYRCHTDETMDPEEKPGLPWYARAEMADASWMRPAEIPLERWRYAEQSQAFLKLIGRALDEPSSQ